MKPFFIEIPYFWAWTDNLGRQFWDIWGMFGRFISTHGHFGTVSPLFMFSINQPLFLQNLNLYIQIPNPNKCLGFGYKGLFFCRNNGWLIEMGADKLAKNTPNAPKLLSPICLPNPKILGFSKKKLSLGVRSPWMHTFILVKLLRQFSFMKYILKNEK